MHAFDAPMHGKHISMREFASKAPPDAAGGDDCRGGARKRSVLWRLFPVCAAGAVTLVFALQREAADWGPEAALLHVFLAAFLPLRVHARVRAGERASAVWPSAALLVALLVCARPYDTETVPGVLFVALLLCDCLHVARGARVRSLAANALTLLVLSNAVLCVLVYRGESRLSASYYHASFAALCALLVSF